MESEISGKVCREIRWHFELLMSSGQRITDNGQRTTDSGQRRMPLATSVSVSGRWRRGAKSKCKEQKHTEKIDAKTIRNCRRPRLRLRSVRPSKGHRLTFSRARLLKFIRITPQTGPKTSKDTTNRNQLPRKEMRQSETNRIKNQTLPQKITKKKGGFPREINLILDH